MMRRKEKSKSRIKAQQLRNLPAQQRRGAGYRLFLRPDERITCAPDSEQARQQPPPHLGNYFLYLILPVDESENKIGDLTKYYSDLRWKVGTHSASVRCYKEAARMFGRHLPKAHNLLFYTRVEETIHRFIQSVRGPCLAARHVKASETVKSVAAAFGSTRCGRLTEDAPWA